jgi:hypothetical protein
VITCLLNRGWLHVRRRRRNPIQHIIIPRNNEPSKLINPKPTKVNSPTKDVEGLVYISPP